jgi:hypothetical protein
MADTFHLCGIPIVDAKTATAADDPLKANAAAAAVS